MITVCMATYNGERYIARQIASILHQIGSDDEVVVADDGSTDNTVAIIEGFHDNRIRIIPGAGKHSPIWNFEKALREAKGDYIYLADQDDEWMPDKIEATQKYLQFFDCVVSDNIVVDGQKNIIAASFYKVNRTRQGRLYNLLIKNGYLGCCMAFNRKVLNASLPFPKNIPMHDIWIGNIAALHFKVKFIPEKLIYFCRHGDNSSPTAGKSKYPLKDKLLFRWHILTDIANRRIKTN